MKKLALIVASLAIFLPFAVQANEYRGLIEPHRIIKIGSPQAGVLATVEIDRGDIVKKGQVLATLDSGVEKAAMEASKYRSQMEGGIKGKQASLVYYEKQKARIDELIKKDLEAQAIADEAESKKAVAETDLRDAVETKELAKLEYRRASEQYERMIIKSPVDGVVMERFLSPGEYVQTEPIVKIAEIDPLNVEVIMPASQLLSVKVGMKATVIPEAPINGRYTATVKVVDSVVDGASGTFGVRLELPNPDSKLPAGLKARVIFGGK
jgi:RND family efflux transporter MFP subunit